MRLALQTPKIEDSFAVEWSGPLPKVGDVLEFPRLKARPAEYETSDLEVRFLVIGIVPFTEAFLEVEGKLMNREEARELRKQHGSSGSLFRITPVHHVPRQDIGCVKVVRYLGSEPTAVRSRPDTFSR